MQYYKDYLSLTDSTAVLPTLLLISLLVLLRLMVCSAIPGISAAWQLVLLTVHISGHICRTHHTTMCCIYQTKSAASNLQFGPTKRRTLSAAVDTASRAVGHTKAWPTPLLLPTPQPHPLGRGLSPYKDALGTASSRWWSCRLGFA